MNTPAGTYLTSDDAQIFYVDYPAPNPASQTLILLHGNGEDHSYFTHQVSFFSAKYRLVLMDTRGQGKSSPGSCGLDFTIFANDLLRLMDTLNIPSAHLLGFSDGGNLALTFALSHPERVSSLILNGANLNPSGVKLSTQLPVVLGYYCCKLLSPLSKKAAQNASVLGLMVKHPHIKPEKLSPLTMPALIIVGEKDMIKESHSQLIAASLPDATFIRIAGADHFCAAKYPEEFNQSVDDFLATV